MVLSQIFGTLHFPTPFSDEVLDQVAGKEAYSFTDNFFGYLKVRITNEDKHENTFTSEWGSFPYNGMAFGLNNSPIIFSRILIVAFQKFINKFLEIYMNDWTIYSLLKEHISLLRIMFDR